MSRTRWETFSEEYVWVNGVMAILSRFNAFVGFEYAGEGSFILSVPSGLKFLILSSKLI